MKRGIVSKAYIVSGLPHIYLAADRNPGWQKLHDAYAQVRADIEKTDADLILYCSTQWLSVIGYLFQAHPNPEWTLVDGNWHEFGSIPYKFRVDTDFAAHYAQTTKQAGVHTALVNYSGFPIDTGIVVAQKFLNPDNRLPAAMVSCNMYSDKNEMLQVGQAGARALDRAGKRAIVVLVSNLSNRFHVRDIDPAHDKLSSAKDHEWNLKVLELLEEGRLEDVSQCARDFAREANGDMDGRGLWWLNGLCGQSNQFKGQVYEYQPVWGTGAALVGLTPTQPVQPLEFVELEAESDAIEAAVAHDPYQRREEGASIESQDTALPPAAANPAPMEKLVVQESAAVTGEASRARAGNAEAMATPQASGPVNSAPTPTPPAANRDGKIHAGKAPEPVGAYPHARREGDFLFLSGIGPRKPGTKDIPGVTFDAQGKVSAVDILAQTESVVENVRLVLEAAGSSLDKVVDVTCFLTDIARDFKGFNQVYAKHFTDIGATRTTVEVNALPTPIAVEFKVIAKP